jgi:putative thioredoxin
MAENQANNILVASDPTFELDVYGRSNLVIVDFWAPWCAPCRMLMPILEKIAVENADWITLIKVNTDECPVAAGNFGIQGIPAVFAVLNDEVVDQFQGALPETAIRQWVAKLKSKVEMSRLETIANSDPAQALKQLRDLAASNPNDDELVIRLAQQLIVSEETAEAQELIDRLDQRGFLEPAAARIKAQLSLLQKSQAKDIPALRKTVEQAPKDFEAKLKLAEALAGVGEYVEACELGLQLVVADRRATGEKARELMVEIFRVLPEDSEITSNYRRQLALALY